MNFKICIAYDCELRLHWCLDIYILGFWHVSIEPTYIYVLKNQLGQKHAYHLQRFIFQARLGDDEFWVGTALIIRDNMISSPQARRVYPGWTEIEPIFLFLN